jgi:hypothetical protein
MEVLFGSSEFHDACFGVQCCSDEKEVRNPGIALRMGKGFPEPYSAQADRPIAQ